MLSDIAECVIARTYVATDQTQRQCAEEHCCPPDTKCPLEIIFPPENIFGKAVDQASNMKYSV